MAPPRTPLEFLVEVPAGGLVKWGADGGVDFVSPLPCPFNYGSIPGLAGADGDPQDAVLLGARRPRGSRVEVEHVATVGFLDGGVEDHKWICRPAGGARELTAGERRLLLAFFSIYARVKSAAARLRGRAGARLLGLHGPEGPPPLQTYRTR